MTDFGSMTTTKLATCRHENITRYDVPHIPDGEEPKTLIVHADPEGELVVCDDCHAATLAVFLGTDGEVWSDTVVVDA